MSPWAKRGEDLERAAAATEVQERNRDLKDIGWLERELKRVQEQIAELVDRIAKRARKALQGRRSEPEIKHDRGLDWSQ